MDKEQMTKLAEDKGFTQIGFIETSQMEFNPYFRTICEENDCGNYGKNYACPPDCGSVEQMKERVLKYKHAMVMQSCFDCQDFNDSVELKKYKKEHIRMMDELLAEGVGDISKNLVISTSCCSVCATCAKVDGEPCRFPEKIRSCLSAYCVNAAKLAQSCGMTYWYGERIVSYFSVFLY